MIKLTNNDKLIYISIEDVDFENIDSDVEIKIANSKKINIQDEIINKRLSFVFANNVEGNTAPLVLLNPSEWSKQEEWKKINGEEIECVNLSIMNKPHVFGGRIRRRNSKFHEFSQLLVNSEYQLSKNSYGVLDGTKTLPSDLVKEIDGSYYLDCQGLGEPKDLKGDYLFIGSIHRHFGHFLVEGLSRLWALQFISKDIKDNMQYLVYEDSIPDFAAKILVSLGIPLNKIVYAPKHAIVERLFVPDVSYKTHHWASILMQSTFKKISSNVIKNPDVNRKIYLSRKNTSDRPLENEADIEVLFSSFGFQIVYPEDLSIIEQVKLVSESKFIAGPVGSQMYLSSFSNSASVLVFAPSNFYLPDDLLLSNIREGRLTVCFGSDLDYSKPKEDRKWFIDLNCVKEQLGKIDFDE